MRTENNRFQLFLNTNPFPLWELLLYLLSSNMRIISRKILTNYWEKHLEAEQALKSWFDELSEALWKSPNELKLQYRNVSIISNKRVVFNIHGNKYRLVVDVEYRIGIVFTVWIGTHKEYDRINVKEIKYVKTN